MGSKKVSITLPDELYDLVEKARKFEKRTRSEVMQEALRSHFGSPVYVPTPEERAMLEEALIDLRENPDSGRPAEEVEDEIRRELAQRS